MVQSLWSLKFRRHNTDKKREGESRPADEAAPEERTCHTDPPRVNQTLVAIPQEPLERAKADIIFVYDKAGSLSRQVGQAVAITLFRFTFVISLRNAAPSKGLSNSKAHNRSSETLMHAP